MREPHKQLQDFGDQDPPAPANFGQRLDSALGFLRRQYLVILIGVAIALPVGAVYYFTAPPSYTASATIMIETRRTALQDTTFGSATPDSSWIESQIGVLKSLNVAAYVVKQLRLEDDPEFSRNDPSLIDRILVRLRLRPSTPQPSEADRTARAVAAVTSGLDVRRIGLSYMMRVDFRSANPELAARVANAMIDAYIYEQLNAKYQANRRASDWLQERLQTLREQAAAAERAVIEFKSKNNIVSAGGALINDKQLTEVNSQLVKARSAVADLEARLARIEAVRQAYGEDRPISSFDETVSEAMGNTIISGLRTRYLDLVNREAEWSSKYGKNHAAVVNTRSQIRDIRKSMRDELGRIEETFRSELQIATRRREELEKAFGGSISQTTATNQAQVTLFSLESAAQSYRKLYDNFLQRHTEVVQQQSFPVVEARSLSPAGVAKTGPNSLKIWLATIFAGAAFGIGGGMLREALDRGFRTREQVRSVLQTDCLALVPRLPPQARRLTAQRSIPLPMPKSMSDPEFATYMARRASAHPSGSKPNVMETAVDAAHSSPYAEAIRSIKLSVDLNSAGTYTKVIGLTSSLPSEGKSTLASAMATVVSQGGARVLLVDCDLRNPSLSRMLTPEAKVGILDVISGKVPLAEAVWSDPSSTLSFLPTIADGRYPHAAEVLSSEAAKSLFDSLQIRYDYVILDLAPLVSALDVRATAHVVDSYVMVVEWGATKVDAVKYALRHVPGVQEKLVGVVLNKVDMNTMKYYDNYGAVYYYGQSRHAVH